MSERNKAISTLKAARDKLAERLTRAVNEADGFVDSMDDDYGPTHDIIFDLGDKLWRLGQALYHLPAEIEPVKDQFYNAGTQTYDCSSSGVRVHTPEVTWDEFISDVMKDDRRAAANTLMFLADIDSATAQQATAVFAGQLAVDDGQFAGKANSLRAQLRAGSVGSLTLIRELFGIRGTVLTRVYHSLKSKV